jgi:predicted metalloprotease with PDZ domain
MRSREFVALFIAAILASGAAEAPKTSPFPPPVARPGEVPFPGVITLDIDARDVERRIVSIKERVPVAGGPITLLYPEWIPGHHSPSGPIDRLAGLKISANGKPVAWKRDPVNVYAFHVEAPEGAGFIDVEANYLSATDKAQGRIEITPNIANLQWNALVLYPAGYPSDAIEYELSLRLPKGWGFASALSPQTGVAKAGKIKFEKTTLETLVDSPMFAGAHYKRIDLDASGPAPVHLNLFGDNDEMIAATEEQIGRHRALIEQADRLYRARHFDRYDFLFAVSDEFGGIGLEHHRSSENAQNGKYFVEAGEVPRSWTLLPHEYTHSWNGKFRRPADLYTANFDVPMRDSLLWVYEGMTQYWGQVLTARSGMWSRETALDALADTAAYYDYRSGRAWRPLADTTNDPIILGRAPQAWNSWQRNEDYYSEGLLVWLDADTLIRERTNGAKSLDDFAAAFFGAEPGRITPLTYVFEDVVAALNAVMPYDWAAFLKERVDKAGGPAPLDGFVRGGWTLVYNNEPNAYTDATDGDREQSTFKYSLGFVVGGDGVLKDVQWDSPAFNAAMKVGDTIVAVNNQAFSAKRVTQAIRNAQKSKKPIEFLVKSGETFRTAAVDYHGGLRIPHLVRREGAPDLLGAILTAKPAPGE